MLNLGEGVVVLIDELLFQSHIIELITLFYVASGLMGRAEGGQFAQLLGHELVLRCAVAHALVVDTQLWCSLDDHGVSRFVCC